MKALLQSLLLIALLTQVQSFTIFTDYFSSDNILGGAATANYQGTPVYPIGNLVSGMALSFTISIPNSNSATPFQRTTIQLFNGVTTYTSDANFNINLCSYSGPNG